MNLKIQLYMDLYKYIQTYDILLYIHFIHYWTKNVILMHDIDKIIIDITFK